MKPYLRSDRVSGQIQRVLSETLKKKINDPRLKTTLITGVKMSPDLRIASVYFAATGSKTGVHEMSAGLKSAKGYMKRILAQKLDLRYTPDIRFFYDESFDYARQIENLLQSIHTDNETDNTTVEKE